MECLRLGRPAVKSTKALTMARVEGELAAKAKWKNSKKGWETSLRDHIGLMIDKIDPLELVATLGLTMVVYDLIQNSNELLAKFALTEPPPAFVIPIIGQIEQILIAQIDNKQLTPEQQAQLDSLKTADPTLFLKSFAIAYFLMKNGSSILNSTQGITGAIAGFLGLGVIAA
jgi:hypothetical protein